MDEVLPILRTLLYNAILIMDCKNTDRDLIMRLLHIVKENHESPMNIGLIYCEDKKEWIENIIHEITGETMETPSPSHL